METTPVGTAESAALDAANSVATPELAPSITEQPKIAKATDIFKEVEADIKKTLSGEQPRDEAGRFAPKEDAEGETPVEAASQDTEAPAVEATPEATEETKPERKLAAEFKVTDKDGELEIPDITITYTANGKERTDPLDKVVKLAQWGAYNEERETAVRETREELSKVSQVIEQKDQQLASYAEAYRQLLADEDFYLRTREEYANTNTPEAQLKALRAERDRELQARQEQDRDNQIQAQATQFVQYLAPKLEALVSQNPSVTFDEVFGRYNLLTAPLLVAGRIPPDRFRAVDHLVETELSSWVESQHSTRSKAKQQDTAKVADAKRQLARAVAPKGTIPAPTPKTQPQKSYTKATDIFADIPALVSQATS